MGVTEKIARFIVETDFEKLPPAAVSIVKNALLDTLGVTLVGSVEPAGKIITDFVNKMGCKPVAGVIGGKIRTSSPNAALANGTMVHALDYDDGATHLQGHPSSCLVPTTLALGEELKVSGKEIITAYVVGVEVWSRIISCMPLLHLKGWHPTGVFGTLSAAAAAAKLLKLNVEQTRMVLGLAGSESAGVGQNFGTMTKPLHAGNAARNGIVAAMLVKDGFTATKDILEGHFSFPVAFSGGSAVDVPKMAENLGNPLAIVSGGVNVKKYPTCYLTHKAIDAMLDLVNKYDIKPDQVEAVDCLVPYRATKVLFYTDPQNKLESKFSMQFTLAVAIADRRVGLEQVTDEKLKDPVIQELMKKVSKHAYADAEAENRTDEVTVRLKNGKEYSHGVLRARGHHDVPLTRDELLNKYQECAKRVLKSEDIQRSIELLENLEELRDIRELMDIAIGGGGRAKFM